MIYQQGKYSEAYVLGEISPSFCKTHLTMWIAVEV